MSELFTTREIATALWGGGFLLACLTNSEVRRLVRDLVRTAVQPDLLKFLVLTAIYVVGEVAFLAWTGIWSYALWKETLLWFILTAVVAGGRSLISRDRISYAEVVTDGFRIVVVVQFFVGLAPFPLAVELALVPTAAAIGLGLGAAEVRGEETTKRFFRTAELGLGLLILGGALSHAVDIYREIAARDGLLSFIIAPLLSLFFIPAVHLWAVYARYEWLFGKLRGTRRFKWWARARLILMLGLRPEAILAFGRRYVYELPDIRDRQAFRAMLASPSWMDRVKAGEV